MFRQVYPSPCQSLSTSFDDMMDENNENIPLSPLHPNIINSFMGDGQTTNCLKTRSGKEYIFSRSVPTELMALYSNPKRMLNIYRKKKILTEELRELRKLYRDTNDELEEVKEENTALYQHTEDLLSELESKNKEIERLKKQIEDIQKFPAPTHPFSSPNRRNTLTPKKRLSITPRRKSICFVKDAGFIRVYARVRPFVESEDGISSNALINHLRYSEDNKNIYVYKDHDLSNSHMTKEYKFTLDRVFTPNHTNEDVFSLSSLKDDISTVLNGGRVSIFAYGHTGSGKTHTMVGEMGKRSSEMSDCHGILQKSLMHLFFRQDAKVHVSVIEVYGEQCFDLIDGRAPMKKSVDCAEKVPVKNMNEVLQCIEFALENRTIAETQGNTNSSRSHCIFRITVESQRNNQPIEGVFNVVDLAGSEKPDESLSATSQIRKETQAINKSLCLLSSVIKAKIQGNSHVPYRDTLLTALLKKDLSQPESKMNIIINISPRPDLTEKTLNSLQFVKAVSVSEFDQL